MNTDRVALSQLHYLCAVIVTCLLLSAQMAQAADSPISGIGAPESSPSRSFAKRSHLIDGSTASSWRGRRGKSTISFTLNSPREVSKVQIDFKGKYTGKRISVLTGGDSGNMTTVAGLFRPRANKGGSLELLLPQGTSVRYLTLELKGKRRRAKRRHVPVISEITLFEESSAPGDAPSVPTPPGSGTLSPTPSPSPSPSPTPITPLQLGGTFAASLNSAGAQSLDNAKKTDISDDGRYVVFSTRVGGFLNSSTSTVQSVFLRDRNTGTTSLVSKALGGSPVYATDPSISGDGRYIAYSSRSNSIVAGDSNSGAINDVFLYDRVNNSTALISISSAGVQSNNICTDPFVSGTGRYVVFRCLDTILAAGDNNGKADVFWHDTQTQLTHVVSINDNGELADDDAYQASVSDDGRYVVWDSRAENLIPGPTGLFNGDTNNTSDVFIHDTLLATTRFVSINSSGAQGADESDTAEISGDGSTVVFQSFATNLGTGAAGERNIIRHDLATSTNTVITRSINGGDPNGPSYFPSVSDDGRFVAFESEGTDIVPNDNNGFLDVFVYDALSGQALRVSTSSAGVEGNDQSSDDMGAFKAISGDGMAVAYETKASNLFSGDANNRVDVVVSEVFR